MLKNIIEKIPIPISGLILAFLSLGTIMPEFSLKFKCVLIGVILIILLLLKVIYYPNQVLTDLSNPIILSCSGTFSMALMILSTYLNPFNGTLAIAIWILGIALHILLIVWFTYRFIIREFDINAVYPSYWIVYVGISMAAITAHVHGLSVIGFICFWFGFASMIITLPLVIYRYLRYPNIEDQNKPLICIFSALISILIVGYINSVNVISIGFLMVMYLIAFVFFLFALVKLISYDNMDFYPSFSAFTFPFVITTIASIEVSKIISEWIFSVIIPIQALIAGVLVIYVLYKYVEFLIS
jgi:exfoliative toxin A/B